MIRLVVCDLDDTLLRGSFPEPSEENARAIRKAMRAGVGVTFATGRLYATAAGVVHAFDTKDPVIVAGGAEIRREDRIVDATLLPDNIVRGIVELAHKNGLRKYLFCNGMVVGLPEDRDEARFRHWAANAGGVAPVRIAKDMDELMEIASGSAVRAVVWPPSAEGHDVFMKQFRNLSPQLHVVCGQSFNIEVTAAGATKANALKKVCAMCGVGLDEVMAIGDSENDIDMLKAAGLGVAVANAVPEVLAAADAVVPSCTANGVAHAIDQFLFHREA